MAGRALGLWLAAAAASLAWAAAAGKVDAIGPLAEGSVPERVRTVLESRGYRVSGTDGAALCEFWLRKGVPVSADPEAEGALFSQLARSALLGVIAAKPGFSDYRGQSIKPGLYTMRYALLPNDGNHAGVAPSRDFVLLVPAQQDPNPDAVMPESELVSLSRHASATNHPAPLNLMQTEASEFPELKADSEGHLLVAVRLKMTSGEVPLGIVVKGKGE